MQEEAAGKEVKNGFPKAHAIAANGVTDKKVQWGEVPGSTTWGDSGEQMSLF